MERIEEEAIFNPQIESAERFLRSESEPLWTLSLFIACGPCSIQTLLRRMEAKFSHGTETNKRGTATKECMFSLSSHNTTYYTLDRVSEGGLFCMLSFSFPGGFMQGEIWSAVLFFPLVFLARETGRDRAGKDNSFRSFFSSPSCKRRDSIPPPLSPLRNG